MSQSRLIGLSKAHGESITCTTEGQVVSGMTDEQGVDIAQVGDVAGTEMRGRVGGYED